MEKFYEPIPLPECVECPYRLTRLAEEEDEEKYGPRGFFGVMLSSERSCFKDSCILESPKRILEDLDKILEEDGRRESSSSPIFINGIKLEGKGK